MSFPSGGMVTIDDGTTHIFTNAIGTYSGVASLGLYNPYGGPWDLIGFNIQFTGIECTFTVSQASMMIPPFLETPFTLGNPPSPGGLYLNGGDYVLFAWDTIDPPSPPTPSYTISWISA